MGASSGDRGEEEWDKELGLGDGQQIDCKKKIKEITKKKKMVLVATDVPTNVKLM